MRRIALLALGLVVLAACSKDKDVDRPKELVDFKATLRVQRIWTASVGGDKTPLRLGLGLAVADGKVYDLGPGDVIWTGVGCIHSFENVSAEPVRWLETQAPLPPAREVFRFERDWARLTAGA